MKVGLLWFDADRKKPLQQKIDDAAEHYRHRFGTNPNACHVNPSEVVSHPFVRVVGNRHIQPHYFWLGVEQGELAPSPPSQTFGAPTRR